jgi:hypothetical protein
MAPKPTAESYLTEDRKEEIKCILESKGLESSVNVRELEKLDQALDAGWTCPSASACENIRKAETTSARKKKLATYAVRAAREHIGEPVGGAAKNA